MIKRVVKPLKSKYFWSLLFTLAIIRVAAPQLILRNLNKFLGEFSPTYAIHINNLDLAIFRGAYRLNDVRVSLKKQNQTFFKVDMVDVSLAWRELFHGQVLADAVCEGLDFVFTPELKETITAAPEKPIRDAKTVKAKLFPIRVGRIDIRNSSFQYADLPDLPEVQRWKVTGLNGRLSNVLPTEANPISLFIANGSVLGSSTIKAAGHLDELAKPMRWDIDVEMREFDLVKANSLLKRRIPLTFTSGHLDIYAEAKSENGKIEGSVKPFFKKVAVFGDGEHFLGLKHFGIEIATATANLILRNARDQTVATKILFSYDKGKFELNSKKALSDAIAHGFQDKINPGIENQYKLSTAELTRKTIQ